MRKFIDELKRRNVLRVAAGYVAATWLLIQVAEIVVPVFGLPDDWIRKLVIVLAAAFVPALAVAWAFEWTPEGFKRESDVQHDDPALRATDRRFDRIVIVVLAIAVLFFAVDKFGSGPRPASTDNAAQTLAVLPFADLSPERDQAWLGDGVAEEILRLLARTPSLRVASRTSSFSFRDSGLAVDEIADSLGVSHVLEGSVRRDGERARITVQLVSAADGFRIWSDSYDLAVDDIFSVQEDIARQIVEALEVRLSERLLPLSSTDSRAYTLFLQARYLARQGSAESLDAALDLFDDALEIDPDYAPAWSSLASVYINEAAGGRLDYDEGHRLATEAARRSIEIDPRHASGYAQLAWIAFWYDADLDAAFDAMRTALDAAPDDPALLDMAATLVAALGRLDEAVAMHEFSTARSPVDPVAIYNLGLSYKYADRLDEAERAFRKLLTLSPDYAGGRYQLGETLLLAGRPEAALEAWSGDTDDAYRLKGQALAHHALGNEALADEALAALVENWGEQWPSEIAHVYAWRGENDAAFDWLEREYQAYGAGGWGEWKLQRLYDNLRDDPRWAEFLERVGVSEGQLAGYALEAAIEEL